MPRKENPLQKAPLFGRLPFELSENLRRLNPWWTGEPGPAVPAFNRWPSPSACRDPIAPPGGERPGSRPCSRPARP